ncbi:MAG: phosphatidylinositol mannoside acyltransferase [Acidimicrobiia bacterium]
MKDYLGYLALRAGVGLVGLLPAGGARALGRVFGWCWHLAAGGRRLMAQRHMRRVLGDGADVGSAAEAVMVSYGRYWTEALWARPRRVADMRRHTHVEGLDLAIAARDAGTGMVFALPHLGNWEAAAPVAVLEGIPIVAVAEQLANQRITDWFTAMRSGFGIEIILATGSGEVMRQLETALGQNKAVALLSDRDLKGRGVEVEFFGEKTTLPPGPATLALRTGAPLFPVATYFEDRGHRVVITSAIPVPKEGTRSEKVRAMTQELAHRMEKLISEAPQQWHLVVPNWPSDRQ